MLYKWSHKGFVCTIFCILLTSCTSIDLNSPLYQAEITTTLSTQEYKEEFSIINSELQRLFTTHNPMHKCTIDIGIQKKTIYSGLSSARFSVNKTIDIVINYSLTCEDNLKTRNTIIQSADLTLQQTQTVAQYVSERRVSNEICNQIAKSIHDEIKLFFAVQSTK